MRFSGCRPLIRAYIGQGLRKDLVQGSLMVTGEYMETMDYSSPTRRPLTMSSSS